ncbi:MAG: hypothetical protein WD004_00050 [Actinomycetota bacterium]
MRRGFEGRGAAAGAAALLSIALASCSQPVPEAQVPSAADIPVANAVMCDVDLFPPDRFELQTRAQVDESDHVGVRMSYRDPNGRRLHFTSGISGEIGEALPEAGRYQVPTGGTGRLLGLAGGSDTWILVWQEEQPCDARSVTGLGFTRAEFEDVLAASGLIPPQD